MLSIFTFLYSLLVKCKGIQFRYHSDLLSCYRETIRVTHLSPRNLNSPSSDTYPKIYTNDKKLLRNQNADTQWSSRPRKPITEENYPSRYRDRIESYLSINGWLTRKKRTPKALHVLVSLYAPSHCSRHTPRKIITTNWPPLILYIPDSCYFFSFCLSSAKMSCAFFGHKCG